MKQNTKKLIAITGKIASGKSYILNELKKLNYNTLNADEINKELLKDKKYLSNLFEIFPEAFDNNILLKDRLKKIIFQNSKNIEEINKLSHPIIIDKIKEKFLNLNNENLIVEISAPTDNVLTLFDKVIVIEVDDSKLLKRLKNRENISEELAKKIIQIQEDGLKLSKGLKKSVIIQNNNIDKNILILKILDVLNKI